MKNLIYLTIIGLIFISCSNGGDDEPEIDYNPSVPALVAPINNKACIDQYLILEWNKSTDVNNSEIIYELQIAQDDKFTVELETYETDSNSVEYYLDGETTYYWRVKATNAEGLSSNYSPTYKFYTVYSPEPNTLPYAPELVEPSKTTTVNTTNTVLQWTATDPDGSDILNYDVYFGTANPPTEKIAENQSENTLEVTVEPATKYYWKVVAKDDKGGETVGKVWDFTTN